MPILVVLAVGHHRWGIRYGASELGHHLWGQLGSVVEQPEVGHKLFDIRGKASEVGHQLWGIRDGALFVGHQTWGISCGARRESVVGQPKLGH